VCPIIRIATRTIINIGQINTSIKLFFGDIVIPSSKLNTIVQGNIERSRWLGENNPTKGGWAIECVANDFNNGGSHESKHGDLDSRTISYTDIDCQIL
jgi:hypothetical protein